MRMPFVTVRVVLVTMVMPAAALFLGVVMRVVVPTVLVIMVMIAGSMRVLVIVRMVMPAVAMLVIVRMVMPAILVVVIMIIVGMPVIMALTARIFAAHRQQIEKAQHGEADAGHEHHRAENPIRRQVIHQTTAVIKIQQHAAPQQEHGDTEEMNEGACSTHGD